MSVCRVTEVKLASIIGTSHAGPWGASLSEGS